MRMSVGDRVVVLAEWSQFMGHSGTVTLAEPYVMVRVDGDTISIRFWESEVELDWPLDTRMGGAE